MSESNGENNQSFLIYQDDNGISNVTVRFEGEDVWLTAEQLQMLFQASQQDVNHHIQQIYAEGELLREATSKKYLLVRNEQKVTDIFATSIDYDRMNDITRTFFATIRNKLHYAAHKHTAAELIHERVDADKPMVGMTNFDGTYITEDDVKIAKNYLSENELQYLRLLVSQFLDFAELQALEQRPMHMHEWIGKLDAMLTLSGRQLLHGAGKISHEEACRKAVAEFREYRRREMLQYESDFDRAVRELTQKPGDDTSSSTP